MMNVAFLVGKFPTLSETFILDQITGLVDAGEQIDIFSTNQPADFVVQPEVAAYNLLDRTQYLSYPPGWLGRLTGAGQALINLPRSHLCHALASLNVPRFGREAYSLRLLYLLRPFLNGTNYDVLHCHFGNIGHLGVRLKQMGVPGRLVVTFHGYDISRLVYNGHPDLYLSVFEQADLLLPVSEFWRQRLIDLGADAACVQVHHMGINTEQFPYHARVRQDDEPVRLLTIGRLVEKKGIDIALRAVAEVLRRHPRWEIEYDIIGSGPMQPVLEELIDSLDLGGRVRLLGPLTREDIFQHMHAAHLCLLPSVTAQDGDQEGIPVSLMEAMATGMPILSTQHSGISELVQDGISGLLAEEQDVPGLADRLEYLIDHPEQWGKMGLSGRQYVETHFNNRCLIPELKEIYQSLA